MRVGHRSLPLLARNERRVFHTRQSSRQLPHCVTAGSLLFAADDVIYDATVWWRWVVQLLTRIGVHTRYSAVYRIWQRDYRDLVNRGECDVPTALRRFLLTLGLTPGQAEEVLLASLTRRKQLAEQLRPLPDVRPALAALRAEGFPMAVVSSDCHDLDVFSARLRRCGLSRLFDVVFCATELGHAAADRALFDKISQSWTGHAGPIAFVGCENAELDAARATGMVTIACRQAESASDSPQQLCDLCDLPAIVQQSTVHLRAG